MKFKTLYLMMRKSFNDVYKQAIKKCFNSYIFKALTYKINGSSFKRKDKQAKFKTIVKSKRIGFY